MLYLLQLHYNLLKHIAADFAKHFKKLGADDQLQTCVIQMQAFVDSCDKNSLGVRALSFCPSYKRF